MEIIIGHGTDWYNRGPFKVNADKHTALYGESGTGKTVTETNLCIEDIRANRPVVFIDPHDEAVKRIADCIPKHRLDDVIWLDPLSPKPIGLNVLGGNTREEKLKRADQFIDTASKIYGENSWGGASAYIARNILYAVIEVEPDPNPLHLFHALMSEEYRNHLFEQVTSENLRLFKKKFDEDWKESDRENRAAAPTNKVDTFVANWIIRDMLCQSEGLDFFEAFERNAIILCPLGKGRLGPETSAFLGSLIMQECFFAGLSRERLRPADRKPVRIYIDEFHNFVKTDAADYILSELRKYGISMVAADQNVKVLPRENFISKIVLRVDAESAKVLAQEMAADISDALTRVPNFHAWAQTVLPAGFKSDAKFIRLREPIKRLGTEYPAWRVIRHSEQNHGVAREKVEREINRFLAA